MRTLSLLLVMLVTGCSSLLPQGTVSDSGNTREYGSVVGLLDPETLETYCTGVITEQGILTAAHCVDDTDVVHIGLRQDVDYQTETFSRSHVVRVLERNENFDLALLGNVPGTESAPIASRLPEVGETVYVVGHPFGLVYTTHRGIVSGPVRNGVNPQPVHWFQIDAGVYPGNSGGPVFSENGDVLGIVSFGKTQMGIFTGTLGMAVPVVNISSGW